MKMRTRTKATAIRGPGSSTSDMPAMDRSRPSLEPPSRRVDRALGRALPRTTARPQIIHRAMRYTALSDGKRLRPALVILAYEAAGGRGRKIDPVAAAVEMVHAFSLIHDDLPAMDDDDMRRGKPANHVAFGEGVAILAGDALWPRRSAPWVRRRPRGPSAPRRPCASSKS